jgi:hypothetical protein
LTAVSLSAPQRNDRWKKERAMTAKQFETLEAVALTLKEAYDLVLPIAKDLRHKDAEPVVCDMLETVLEQINNSYFRVCSSKGGKQ